MTNEKVDAFIGAIRNRYGKGDLRNILWYWRIKLRVISLIGLVRLDNNYIAVLVYLLIIAVNFIFISQTALHTQWSQYFYSFIIFYICIHCILSITLKWWYARMRCKNHNNKVMNNDKTWAKYIQIIVNSY